jgi:hypothetical protein
VRIGAGALASCAPDCAAAGATNVLLITSPQIVHLCDPLVRDLEGLGIAVTVWSDVAGEPTRADLASAIAVARAFRTNFVIALGGGSPMDLAKLVAALADGRQQFDAVVGIGLLQGRALPLACIPDDRRDWQRDHPDRDPRRRGGAAQEGCGQRAPGARLRLSRRRADRVDAARGHRGDRDRCADPLHRGLRQPPRAPDGRPLALEGIR